MRQVDCCFLQANSVVDEAHVFSDPKLSPRDRSLKVLNEWCTLELHTVVLDFDDRA